MNILPLLCVALTAAPPAPDYATAVQPLLAKHCVGCHGPDKQRGSLRLDLGGLIRDGGNSGPAVVPGKSAESLLLKAVIGVEGVSAMPPKGPRLTADEVAVLRAWIDAGAAVPAGEVEPPRVASKHWSFQPIARPAPPTVKDAGWGRNPIDAFILARLEKEGVRPSPEADRVTLLRRLSLDLTGLPPTPAEVERARNDESADWYEKVVERLLASPHHGERWGRHWLDVARYADTNGYSIDGPRSIWKYRDWVIDAVNRDLPFDRFTIEQLAGDLLPNATTEQKIATGFHRNTQINQEGGIDLEQFRVEGVVDRVNTTGTAFLGLTVGCCQCHDHKFDPLSQREYYRFFAFFNNADEPTLELATPDQLRLRKQIKDRLAVLEPLQKRLDPKEADRLTKWEGKLTPEGRAVLSAEVRHILGIAVNGRNPTQERILRQAFRDGDHAFHVVAGLAGPFGLAMNTHLLAARRKNDDEVETLKARMPNITTTMVVEERKTPRETTILLGGDFTRKGAPVTPGTPAVLPALGPVEKPTRLDLAKWLVDGNNPLTARVVVNRAWQVYFGLGLVETENDFGTQGLPPSHPELLDWLARAFMNAGWSQKALHRLIVTSATYRQSSHARPDLKTLDPRNRLLARQSRLRLDAEVVRDVALAASGLLSARVGGPGVRPPQPAGVYSFTQIPREWTASEGPDRYRRGMYTYFQRSAPHPGLTVFDTPDGTFACTRRNRSNTPLQALTLLNDQGFYEFAQALAARTLREAPADDASRLGHAFRLCVGREPAANERDVLTRLLARERAALPDEAAWTMVARVLLNLDEFITRE